MKLNLEPKPMTYEQWVSSMVQLKGIEDGFHSRLMLGALGLSGEAGEVTDDLKKVLMHGKELDRDKIAKELGDVLWYLALLAHTIGLTLTDIQKLNIEKLTERDARGEIGMGEQK